MEGFLHFGFFEMYDGFVMAFDELLNYQDSVLLCVVIAWRGLSQCEILLVFEKIVSYQESTTEWIAVRQCMNVSARPEMARLSIWIVCFS